MRKKIDGVTFDKLNVGRNYRQYYIGDAKDYLVWEITEAECVLGLTNGSGKYYGYIYKLGIASFLLVIVEAEKRWEETEIVIEKKEILCKLTVPKDSVILIGDGEEVGATVEELVRNHNWSIAFY